MLGQMCFDEFSQKVEEEEEKEKDKNFEIITSASAKKQMDCWDKFKESLTNVLKKKGNKSSE